MYHTVTCLVKIHKSLLSSTIRVQQFSADFPQVWNLNICIYIYIYIYIYSNIHEYIAHLDTYSHTCSHICDIMLRIIK